MIVDDWRMRITTTHAFFATNWTISLYRWRARYLSLPLAWPCTPESICSQAEKKSLNVRQLTHTALIAAECSWQCHSQLFVDFLQPLFVRWTEILHFVWWFWPRMSPNISFYFLLTFAKDCMKKRRSIYDASVEYEIYVRFYPFFFFSLRRSNTNIRALNNWILCKLCNVITHLGRWRFSCQRSSPWSVLNGNNISIHPKSKRAIARHIRTHSCKSVFQTNRSLTLRAQSWNNATILWFMCQKSTANTYHKICVYSVQGE